MTGSIRNIIKQCTPLLPLFLLIYTSDDTIMFGMFGDVRFYYAKLAVWFSVAMYFAAKGYFLRNKFTVSLFIVAILYFVNSIVSGFSIGFVYNLAIFLLALVYVSNNSFETFREHFCRIVCFLVLVQYCVCGELNYSSSICTIPNTLQCSKSTLYYLVYNTLGTYGR